MCGISGLLSTSRDAAALAAVAAGQAATLAHRGPDAEGVWTDAEAGVALGHRRLSILDLSARGAQPMASASGRLVIAYNGEVFNFAALRDELARLGFAFDGASDTEVLLAAFEAWGVAAALPRFNGMFAFALWDRAARTLHLARDRMGQKPLYVGWAGRDLVFGSELKALRAHPAFAAEVDRDAVALYARFGYVPAPHTVYRGVWKLPPAHHLALPADALVPGERVVERARPYWSLRDVAEAGRRASFAGTPEEAVDAVERTLGAAVSDRLVSDVPLGAFLSGGIDSSLVVALMQRAAGRPVRTFTIGSTEAAYDEAPHARDVAAHLGTDHTELRVTPAEALAVVPRLPALYDEPFADSSQIPTFLVARLAREHVTVALSGDGGDELFAGYNRYAWAPALWRRVGPWPVPARRALARALEARSPAAWDRAFARLGPALPARLRARTPGDKLHKLAGALAADEPAALYGRLVSQWPEPATLVRGAREPATLATSSADWPAWGYAEAMMLVDALTYLPDDILVKVDRASMGVGLEARAPFMDPRVSALAWSLPLGLKLRDGQGKWVLRQALYRHVPAALVERPKMGFAVPLDAWLRGPLRDWADALLDERRLRDEGVFDPALVRAAWADHLAGRRAEQHRLWVVLMFQAWAEAAREAPVPACAAATL